MRTDRRPDRPQPRPQRPAPPPNRPGPHLSRFRLRPHRLRPSPNRHGNAPCGPDYARIGADDASADDVRLRTRRDQVRLGANHLRACRIHRHFEPERDSLESAYVRPDDDYVRTEPAHVRTVPSTSASTPTELSPTPPTTIPKPPTIAPSLSTPASAVTTSAPRCAASGTILVFPVFDRPTLGSCGPTSAFIRQHASRDAQPSHRRAPQEGVRCMDAKSRRKIEMGQNALAFCLSRPDPGAGYNAAVGRLQGGITAGRKSPRGRKRGHSLREERFRQEPRLDAGAALHGIHEEDRQPVREEIAMLPPVERHKHRGGEEQFHHLLLHHVHVVVALGAFLRRTFTAIPAHGAAHELLQRFLGRLCLQHTTLRPAASVSSLKR